MSRTLPTIVSLADVAAFRPVSDAADLARLEMAWKSTEAAIRRYCGQNLVQPSDPYVDILPETDWSVPIHPLLAYGNSSGGGWDDAPYTGPPADGHVLHLSQGLVRSITSVYVDTGGSAGTDVNDFASSTLLSSSEYFLDVGEIDPSGLKLSKSGCIIRKYANWPTRRRSVKVTYVAGYTEAELDAEFSDLRLAVVEGIIARYDAFSSVGDSPVLSERLGDWQITFAEKAGDTTGLDEKLRSYLQPFVRYHLP